MSGVCIGCATLGYPSPPGVDAAGAVAAVIAFREYGADPYFVPLVIASPVPQLYRSITTPVLGGGVYQLTAAMLMIGSNSGTDIDADLVVDGVSLGVIKTEAVVAGGGFLLSATVPQTWAPGTHIIEYFVSLPAGPGSIDVPFALTTWARELS